MDPDLLLMIGVLFGVLAVPASISALSDLKLPKAGVVMAGLAGLLILVSIWINPEGYVLADLPAVFFDVVGRYQP
ncbi:MAG: hypothetical protein ACU0BB_09275 [Paracoccaceae bacterium]